MRIVLVVKMVIVIIVKSFFIRNKFFLMYGWGIFWDVKGIFCKMKSIFEKIVFYICKKNVYERGFL